MSKFLPSWDTDDVNTLVDFSRIELIVADLDGTLLSPGQMALYETIRSLNRSLGSYGVALTLATGRSLSGVHNLLSTLSLRKGVPIILYNGSLVVRNKTFEILSRKTIETNILQAIVNLSSELGVPALAYFYTGPTNQLASSSDNIEYVLGWAEGGHVSHEFNGMRVDWQGGHKITEKANPSAILIDISTKGDCALAILRRLQKVVGISVTHSGQSYLEIRPADSNKGVALEMAARLSRIDRYNILAIGDNDNDLEMLKWAGIGVAVAGSSPNALLSADYVSRHGVIEGAIEVLRVVRNARRYFRHIAKERNSE